MPFSFRTRKLDLQAKISLVLLGVIIPTFVVVTIAENAITGPMLENEMKQLGLSTAGTLADEISDSSWLASPRATALIESRMQEILYTQRNVASLQVFVPSELPGGKLRLLASSVEEPLPSEDPTAIPVTSESAPSSLVESPQVSMIRDEDGSRLWQIIFPVRSKSKKLVGNVVVLVTLKLVERIQGLLWKSTVVAALVSLTLLFIGLRYFLRRTFTNERRLIAAESQNVQLTQQLHEAQRQLMNTEKLAVMGQLTATFAHEIGTPLNAMGGHLQLLSGELTEERSKDRLGVIRSQVEKIEKIVRSFLQSTAQPASSRQLVDVNRVIEQTLSIVGPRAESLGVSVHRKLSHDLGPVRVVPLELEQILLNLVNNSLDSLQSKARNGLKTGLILELGSGLQSENSRSVAVIEVYDSGEGVADSDLKNVWKPFFTTKRPGEGTGLGLTICQQLAKQNGASLGMDSKHGAWTRVTLRIPYA
ncbi:sensor histidine kinase [bacterium]|nr:sensor histidine kinase [bacterium]